MKRYILAFIVAFGFGSSVLAQDPQGGTGVDPFPWPWGAECPFPWGTMTGYWEVYDLNTPDEVLFYLYFQVLAENGDGQRFFELEQYSARGELLARGKASAPKGQKVVRALMTTESSRGEGGELIMAIIRAYDRNYKSQGDQDFSCENSDLVRAVTFYSDQKCSVSEKHLLMRRVPEVLAVSR